MLNKLKNLGLSDNEAKVYLAMLELGPATVLEIAAKAAINRPTTYVQIETLKKKGLVSTQTKGKKLIYIPESPEQLEHLLERESREVEDKMDDLKAVLPELTTMFNLSDEKPQVRFFEGKEGLIKIQDEFLKNKGKESISLSSADDVVNVFPGHPEKYTPRRVKKGIKSRLIYTSRRGPFLKNDPDLLREVKFISPEKLPFVLDVLVYDDVVAIANLKGKISGVIIKNKGIAESFKSLLNFIWNIAN
jgi:HTH-type transcriptional regulator, sugar sensing transcriptional regulator